MKTLFEHMMTEVVIIIVLFVLGTYTIIDLQVMTARRVHASAVSQIQASYYTVDIDDFNTKLHEDHPNWTLTIDELQTYKTRKEYRVSLIYEITVPLFNIRKTGIIEGYTR